MKQNEDKRKSALKKALLATLIVAVPGGTLLGLAYLVARKRKGKKTDSSPPAA